MCSIPTSRSYHKPSTWGSLDWRQLDEATQRLFDIGRFCVDVLYLLLSVCDITPAERYLAAALTSDAVERLSGRTWRERFDRTQPAAMPRHLGSQVR